MYLTNT